MTLHRRAPRWLIAAVALLMLNGRFVDANFLGGASSYDTSVISTSTGTVTATDYSTSATLCSQTSATLASGAVYGMFMFGCAASRIGELSKDR